MFAYSHVLWHFSVRMHLRFSCLVLSRRRQRSTTIFQPLFRSPLPLREGKIGHERWVGTSLASSLLGRRSFGSSRNLSPSTSVCLACGEQTHFSALVSPAELRASAIGALAFVLTGINMCSHFVRAVKQAWTACSSQLTDGRILFSSWKKWLLCK